MGKCNLLLQHLLEQLQPVDATNRKLWTPLHKAAFAGFASVRTPPSPCPFLRPSVLAAVLLCLSLAPRSRHPPPPATPVAAFVATAKPFRALPCVC